MKPLHALTAALTAAALILFTASAAAAATADEARDAVADIETGLLAMFPLVILVSSIVLRPEAAETVKRVVPLVISGAVSVLYFAVENFPGWDWDLLVSVGGLLVLATGAYEPITALLKLITKGRGLNDLTGPGLIGQPEATT